MIRLLVCGGRTFSDRMLMDEVLDNFLIANAPIGVVIEGEAKGADTMAREWAEERGIAVEPYPAKWDEHGRAAGPIRNAQMISEGKPTHAFAFFNRPRHESKGTADMVRKLKRAGIPVEEVGP